MNYLQKNQMNLISILINLNINSMNIQMKHQMIKTIYIWTKYNQYGKISTKPKICSQTHIQTKTKKFKVQMESIRRNIKGTQIMKNSKLFHIKKITDTNNNKKTQMHKFKLKIIKKIFKYSWKNSYQQKKKFNILNMNLKKRLKRSKHVKNQ